VLGEGVVDVRDVTGQDVAHCRPQSSAVGVDGDRATLTLALGDRDVDGADDVLGRVDLGAAKERADLGLGRGFPLVQNTKAPQRGGVIGAGGLLADPEQAAGGLADLLLDLPGRHLRGGQRVLDLDALKRRGVEAATHECAADRLVAGPHGVVADSLLDPSLDAGHADRVHESGDPDQRLADDLLAAHAERPASFLGDQRERGGR